jgi:hypothetical protein
VCIVQRESAGFSLLLDEGGDESCDQILLAAGKSDGLLEDALQPADRTRAALLNGLIAENVLDTDAECLSELRQDV